MKVVKASEARKHWFRLLDEALQGEVIAGERNGQRVVLRRESAADRCVKAFPDYKQLLSVPQSGEADHWSWQWRPQASSLFEAPVTPMTLFRHAPSRSGSFYD